MMMNSLYGLAYEKTVFTCVTPLNISTHEPFMLLLCHNSLTTDSMFPWKNKTTLFN